MKNQEWNRLLSQIREEKVDDAVVSRAGERVWNSIAGSSSAEMSGLWLQECGDFQAAIPAYLRRELSEARASLLEDHFRHCVGCRRALNEIRRGPVPRVSRPRDIPSWRGAGLRWAGAFALLIGVAIGSIGAFNGLLPGQHPVRATVQNVDGSLYYVSDQSARLVSAGYQVRDGDELRTAKGSGTTVRLADGSLIEVGERSGFSVSRGWKGTTIHLDGGRIIVQAAKQKLGGLFVATDDCLVTSKGTVFSVNHGTKGSRVSVLEGAVNVAYGQHLEEIQAGYQTTTSPNLSQVPIRDEVAWSKDSGKFLILLGEFSVLQKQIEMIPGPGLRYKSNLLQYVPDHTILYAAIPNLGSTLSEAERLFENRLQQSPTLRSWWKENQPNDGLKLQDLIGRLESFSNYLGDEVVVAVASAPGYGENPAVMLAEVHQPGLRAFLETQLQQASGSGHPSGVRIVDNPWNVVPTSSRPMLVYVSDNLFVATSNLAELQRIAGLLRHPGPGQFTETPFYQKITQSYADGAGWLFCVDMEQIVDHSVQTKQGAQGLPPGLSQMQYLSMERRQVAGKTENRAAVTFTSRREGMAAWLAAPAPMGSADFVSPEASLAASFVIKDPRSILEELFQFAGQNDPAFGQNLADFEAKTGISVLNDISAPLGGDLTFALDGPLLPTLGWKLVIEVNDPEKLQATIGRLVESFNREAPPNAGKLQLATQQIGPQRYFALSNSKGRGFEIDYTFVDSYMIAAPSRALLTRAIQNRQAGYTLFQSQLFRSQLPSDGYTNFSAILYHNLAMVLTPLSQQLKAIGGLSPQQQQSLDTLSANSAPGLIYAYGEPDRIVVASDSGFMGLDVNSLLTIQQAAPLLLSRIFNLNSGITKTSGPMQTQ
jgi:hypothetical protein